MDKSLSRQVYNAGDQLLDEGYCHENDLVLAAELGKALLARNRDLEDALQKARNVEAEKNSEIEFLQKQLSNLRKFSDERAASVDETDQYYKELDRSNHQLIQEKLQDKEKLKRLSNRVAHLEEEVLQLTDELMLLSQSMTSGVGDQLYQPPKAPRRVNCTIETSSRNGGRCRGDFRCGFIDDEFSDQPELLSIGTPTAKNSRQHLGPDRSRRERDQGGNTMVYWSQLLRSSSCPPSVLKPQKRLTVNPPAGGARLHLPSRDRDKSSFSSEKFSSVSVTCPHATGSDVTNQNFNDLKTLFHGAAIVRELDRIYDAQLQCRLKALLSVDRQPCYRQLFSDAFQLLRKLREEPMTL